MNYVKIYNNTRNFPEQFIIGIINAKLIESIEWYRRPASTEAGEQEYQIHGSYYGSSADIDFSLNLPMIMTTYATDEERARVMNIICDGTASVEGGTGWYLVVLGQNGAELVDTWWYCDCISHYWMIYNSTGSVWSRTG